MTAPCLDDSDNVRSVGKIIKANLKKNNTLGCTKYDTKGGKMVFYYISANKCPWYVSHWSLKSLQ